MGSKQGNSSLNLVVNCNFICCMILMKLLCTTIYKMFKLFASLKYVLPVNYIVLVVGIKNLILM